MMEQLISVGTAKLANEKGFNENKWESLYYHDGELMNHNDKPEPFYLAPTQSILQKWLRENKNLKWPILVYVVPFFSESPRQEQCCIRRGGVFISLPPMDTYEEALEAGLRRGLSLIKTEEQ